MYPTNLDPGKEKNFTVDLCLLLHLPVHLRYLDELDRASLRAQTPGSWHRVEKERRYF